MTPDQKQLFFEISGFSDLHRPILELTDTEIQQEIDLLAVLRERAGWLISTLKREQFTKQSLEPIERKNRTAAIRLQALGVEKRERQIWAHAEDVFRSAISAVAPPQMAAMIFERFEQVMSHE